MSPNLTTATQSAASATASDRLPWAGLLALAMAGFICILTETLPAGLLPQIGDGLGVSEALAGQLVTLYALGSLLAAIPFTTATRGWRRKPLLLLCVIGFLVFNSVTALSLHADAGCPFLGRCFCRCLVGNDSRLCPTYGTGCAQGSGHGSGNGRLCLHDPL